MSLLFFITGYPQGGQGTPTPPPPTPTPEVVVEVLTGGNVSGRRRRAPALVLPNYAEWLKQEDEEILIM